MKERGRTMAHDFKVGDPVAMHKGSALTKI